MYQLTGVTKLYQKGRRTVPAVRGLDLVIDDGEWLAVQGRTGHGKSTLLNLLGGLDRAHRRAPSNWTAPTWARCARLGSPGCAPRRSGSSSRPST